MNLPGFLLLLGLLCSWPPAQAQAPPDYTFYHRQVIVAEKLLAAERYAEALATYETLFAGYRFVFAREYQIAAQLAAHLGDYPQALRYVELGMRAGWDWNSIAANPCLAKLSGQPQWQALRRAAGPVRRRYRQGLNQTLRQEVNRMFARDQRKALRALFTFGPRGQDRYAETRFAPHSERQLAQLIRILDEQGYPGEKLIGNSFWAATILAHHNSISPAYARQDTLYAFLKPKLLTALRRGQMTPEEFALVDDWYRVTQADGPAYGYLRAPSARELPAVDALRHSIGLGSLETRNHLLDLQKRTGLNFYLPGSPWTQGKITIRNE